MEQITTKQHLLDSLGQVHPQLDAFLNSLAPGKWAHPRDAAGWAVKDHMAHLAVRQDGITALLRHQSRWPAMGLSGALYQPLDSGTENGAPILNWVVGNTAHHFAEHLP